MGNFWKFIISSFLDNFKDDFEDNFEYNPKIKSIFLTNHYFKFLLSWFQGKGKVKNDKCKCIGYFNSRDDFF
jgi:hypothetical protein